MTTQLQYDEAIETNGIKVPFVPNIITPPIERPMRNSRYETGEAQALVALLKSGDRVLELGAGIGLLSTIAALHPGVESVIAVEANPELIPMIHETHRINDAKNVTVINGVAAPQASEPLDFYLRQDFWASSMEPDSRPYVKAVKVPACNIAELVQQHRPTVIACDIEGGELSLFDDIDLTGVRVVIAEFHPKVYGQANVDALYDLFARKGLQIVPVDKPTTVRRFVRPIADPAAKDWPPKDPKFLITTCMKDEGPFILEWIAWHKSIGVSNFVVYTNDCTDGTDAILNRLEDLGIVRHLPNPAIATGSTFFQPASLAYTPHLRDWHEADFCISMDVDEFINIRVGDGHLRRLLDATGFFDALSMSELIHGANDNQAFVPGLVTDQFPRHQTERPGFRKSQRGVKTIVRLSDKLSKLRNHRPDFRHDLAEPVWLDGSGRNTQTLLSDASLNGLDVRGTYGLVALNHFPLRSLDSFLIKMFRGDVVIKKNRVSQRYWRMRNRNEEHSISFDRQQIGFKKELATLLTDPTLTRLHAHACEIHTQRAKDLLDMPEFEERKSWILDNAW